MHTRIKHLAAPLSLLLLLGTTGAFAQKTPPPPPPPAVQAPPPPKPPRVSDFDDVRKELDKAAADLEKTTKNFTVPEPPAPPEINSLEIEKALKEIDVEKIRADVAKSLKSIDVAKLQKDVDASLAKIDMAAMQKEIEASMKELKESLGNQKEAHLKIAEELKTLRPKMEAEMKKAKVEIEKAKKELDTYEAFVTSLANDGLINKAAYTIEHKNNKLFIDGKEQPEAVYNKHRSFLEKNKGLKITKNEDGLNIHKD
jgi:transposase-like protein